MIKSMNKIYIKGTYLNIIYVIYDKTIYNIIKNRKLYSSQKFSQRNITMDRNKRDTNKKNCQIIAFGRLYVDGRP